MYVYAYVHVHVYVYVYVLVYLYVYLLDQFQNMTPFNFLFNNVIFFMLSDDSR